MLDIAKELIVDQGSDEWFEARLGKVTSSRLNDVLAKPTKKGEEAAARRNYRAELVLERLTGKTPERFKSKAMEWGSDTEELAATTYSLKTGNDIRKCGIYLHKFMQWGDSPDFMVTDQKGTGEIKCFNSANHLKALRTGKMPSEYYAQVQDHIFMTGSEWCDFISFDPDFPEHAQIFIQRIYPDELFIKNMRLEVSIFLDEVEADIEFLNNYKGDYEHGIREV